MPARKPIVLVMVSLEYEGLDPWYPEPGLEAAGYAGPVAGLGEPSSAEKHGYPCPADGHVRDFSAADLAGMFVLWGLAPDENGPWELISAVVEGHNLLSSQTPTGLPEFGEALDNRLGRRQRAA